MRRAVPTAVLLAAGPGRKFWPYSRVRNKCAFPVANIPVVLRLALQLRDLGMRRLCIVVGTEEGSIRAALRSLPEEDLLYVRQPALPGTATAACAALQALAPPAHDAGLFLVYADIVVHSEDLKAAMDLYRTGETAAVVLATSLENDQPQNWMGVVPGSERSGGGRTIREIEGHSRDASCRLTGVYALAPTTFRFIRDVSSHMTHVPVGGMPPAESDLAECIANMTDDGLETALVTTCKPNVDLDKPWHILQASRIVLAEMAVALQESGSRIAADAHISEAADIEGPVSIESGAEIGKRVVLQGPAWIGRRARVVNGAIVGAGAVIGSGSQIRDYCLVGSGASVGSACIIGHGGEFEGVMLDRSYIYHYSEIAGVVGTAVDLGAATVCGTLRFDDSQTVHRIGGRRETPPHDANATYFGDYCRTGVNVITQPGVKIGVYSCVGPGVIVSQDVPDRKLILLKQETVERDWGPERYGW